MNLGIKGRQALICASSKGLGRACAESLCREGVDITICARSPEVLAKTVTDIRRIGGGSVNSVACDVTTIEGQRALLAVCPEPDIVVNNAGGPPPGDFRDWGYDAWSAALNANMLTPIFIIKATLDGMIERKFGRIVNITSSAVKAPIDFLGLSNGARSGLTGFVAGLARQTACHNVTINSILPGPFQTDRLDQTLKALAEKEEKLVGKVRKDKIQTIPAKRFGKPSELGDLCAYLCSAQAGFITGQNIVIDGGMYPGTF
ncbi:MAG: 3-oxoacyl-[acyl-carrier-protein] reductase FabG [Alphaproteobacteria bacterium MarineAlpha3_Bin5]|nr:3-oxoacyl-ACP reductase [Magnetovibrio sp.]PPR79710.1 MAG: 3-oxoacyl-[acyl-carrier-protein] reductase FabG [Alphaproteobacteria bacterium MarineAlpha3_Bin5]